VSWKKPPARPAKQIEGRTIGVPRRAVAAASAVLGALDALPQVDLQPDKPATAEESAHMGRVAALGCLICRRIGLGQHAAEVHHIRTGQGGAERAPNFLTIPLCFEHHRGNTGFHGLGARAFERRYGIDELGLLAITIRELCH